MTILATLHSERTARLVRLGMVPQRESRRFAALPVPVPIPEPLKSEAANRDWLIVATIGSGGVGQFALIHCIQTMVASRYKITTDLLLSDRRSPSIVWPRHIAIYLASRLTHLSLNQIGKRFAGRDHTTILHAIRRIKRLRQATPDLDAELTHLEVALLPVPSASQPMTCEG